MSKFEEIGRFEAHLETLGLETTHQLATPDETLGFNEQESEREALHSLPELQIGEIGSGATPPDLSLIRTLGEGGMGLVRLARQVALDREVAVKTTRDETGEDAARSLLQEAYITGYLEHPNIIPIYTVGRTGDGAPLIVMKRVEGTSWLELLDDDGRRESGADLVSHIEILMQVASAVRFAHSRGIIHRDIKPENIMVGHFDEIYLLDWGIAVSIDDDKPLLPHRDDSVGICGTPRYMAPEMARQDLEEIDERTDVYLLGATLHHVLTGEPRHIEGDTVLQVMFTAHRSEPYDYGSDIPEELAEIANRACHADRTKRFGSADEFRAALQDFLRHRESIDISASADEKRLELEALLVADEPDIRAVHDTYGECRFGFYQALRMWSENEPARQGLQQCLEAMAQYHLRQGSLESARACIAELPEPRQELEEQADALDRSFNEEKEELERLKRLEQNMDLRRGRGIRSVFMIVLGVLWTVTSLYASIRLDSGDVSASEDLRQHMIAGFRNLGIVAVASFIFRKKIFVNSANRRLVYMMLTMLVAIAFLRWSVWYLQSDIFLARTADTVVFVVTLIAIGLISDLRICVFSIFFLTAGVVSVLWPELQLYANTAATTATFAAFAWIWSPWRMNKKISP